LIFFSLLSSFNFSNWLSKYALIPENSEYILITDEIKERREKGEDTRGLEFRVWKVAH